MEQMYINKGIIEAIKLLEDEMNALLNSISLELDANVITNLLELVKYNVSLQVKLTKKIVI